MKQIKKTLSIFMAAIFVMSGILGNVTAKADQVFNVVSPIINYIGVDHSPLVVGDTEKFTVTSKYDGEVQYRAFLFDGKTWNELTNGYGAPVDAKTPYVLPETRPFKLGKYKLSVWVKRAGEIGISSNKSYDTYYTANLNCVTRDNANRVYASGAAKVETNGLTVKVNGIENIGGIKGPYLYRLFIFNPTSGIWTNGAKEYTESPSFTFDEAGTYMVVVHANTVHSTTWGNYKAGKTKGAYEATKTVIVTVKNEEIVKVIDTTVKADTSGSTVNVTLTTDGTKHFATATQYQIFDGTNALSAMTNLGTSTTVFQAKGSGDKVNVKLFDGNAKEVKDIEVLLGKSGTITAIPPVAVTSVNAINAKQVEIKFNTPVNRVSAETLANYKIASLDGRTMNIGKVEYLNSTAVRATLNFNPYPYGIVLNNGTSYKLTVAKHLVDASGKVQIADLTSTFTFEDDTIPTITKISVGRGRVLVNFSEPIKENNAKFTLKLLDKSGIPTGNNLIGSKVSIADPEGQRWIDNEQKTLNIDFSDTINEGSRYRLSIINKFTDFAGHSVPFKSIDLTYKIDKPNALDKVAPKVLSIKYISQKYVEVAFDKPILCSTDNFYWNTDGIENNSENRATSLSLVNPTTFKVGFGNLILGVTSMIEGNLMTKGNDFLFVKGVQDYSNNIMSTTKIPIMVANDVFEVTSMYVDHGLNATSVDGDEYFIITFSKDINPNTIIDAWDGKGTKDLAIMATKGGAQTISLGNVGTITLCGDGMKITVGGSILCTVSMPNSNQIKLKLGDGATNAGFVAISPSGTIDFMTYKVSPLLTSVDGMPVDSKVEFIRPSNSLLTAKILNFSSSYPYGNNFVMSNNYGVKLDETNVKINTTRDFGVSTAVTSAYKGAVVSLTVTSTIDSFTNGSVSITRAAGSGAAIAKGEILYIRAEDGLGNVSSPLSIVFNKAIEANGAVTNADFSIYYFMR